ncbi:NAD-binding protein [Mycobacterium parmense]|uniref:RCK N-terminal domain-containing protein n=1 Tax=Mycobacterium parmense TaxID=185642 RepID=A0A7I7YXR1_9MYCO|nr:NAD-binding protein [Mycobacterium parmense]MCV7349999.1 NAD-binding protein [Mycobacterium parmense]ORW59280.1 hypothetical protein AWC20_10055 [Mycobacterium parmense]BBZ46469.1 hypothetical protein MPRM_37500 [Mycobacterium parmense]
MLSDYRWYVLIAAGLAAFALGCIGWWSVFRQQFPAVRHPVSDVIYWSLQNFVFNGPTSAGLPWQLDVARYLAPIVAGSATLSAVSSLFRDRVQQMRIPLMRDHVVLCGLGSYVGLAFLRRLRQDQIPVVAIEVDATNPHIGLCRSMGVPVIIGDAQRLKTLQAARAHRATRVLVVSADDAVNTQIVATWRELPGRRSHQPGCLARISDPGYSVLLWIQELKRGDPQLSVDYFNIDEISARLLLREHPFDTGHGQPHILIAHLDPLGVWLVYHAARAWHDARGDNPDKLIVTVLDPHPQERIEMLHGQHSALEKVCEFIPFSTTTRNVADLTEHHRHRNVPALGWAYVTAYQDKDAFEAALKLRHALPAGCPVVVALSRPHGVAGLLGDVTEAEGTGPLANIEVFPTMERTCTVELVRSGSFESMAQAIHESWRREQLAAGRPALTWEELDEPRRESSRAQARDLPAKLRMVNCAITPLRSWEATDFQFSAEEVEDLAIEEHQRWNDERIAAGWTLIDMPEVSDPRERERMVEEAKRRKQTPYLLSWDRLVSLYPRIAETDRIFARAIPSILCLAGMEVVRTDRPTPTSARRAPPS